MRVHRVLILVVCIGLCIFHNSDIRSAHMPDMFSIRSTTTVLDTFPTKERTGDFVTGALNNPFDITPSSVTQEIEYDPIRNQYILIEKIGDEYYRPPTYLTFDEYMDWKAKEDEKKYFGNLSGVSQPRYKRDLINGSLDPMDKIDVTTGLVDKLFGGTSVDIKPQGSVDLTLGLVEYRKNEGNNVFTQSQARQWFVPGEFRIQPRLNVAGGIGKKLNLDFNYDATSTFDFDKKIKLDYGSDVFNEDDILKRLEAGNVSMPLKGSLIKGAQQLFGFKTELQFGHLRITSLASQQRSRPNNLQIKNGASVQEFDIYPDQYDENRHFFLNHYNRDNYEGALSRLPQVNSSFRIAQIEVWVMSDRRDNQERSTLIAGIADIAESNIKLYHDTSNVLYPPLATVPDFMRDSKGQRLPDNRQNPLFGELIQDSTANEADKVTTLLKGKYNMVQTKDFEVFQARLLDPSEYTFHPQLGFISLNSRLRPNQMLAVSYKYFYTEKCDSVFTVGQIASEGIESSESFAAETQPEPTKVIFAKLLKSSNQQTNFPTWDLMMKNVYNLRTSQLTKDGFSFDIFYEDDFDDGSLKKYIPRDGLRKTPLLNIFKLDTLNRFGDPQSDGVFDYIPGVTVIERAGSIVFPVLEPFGSSLSKALGSQSLIDSFVYQELYDTTIVIAQSQFLHKNKFLMRAQVESATSGIIYLQPNIPRGSVRATVGGIQLQEGVDYEIDYSLGQLRVLNPAYLAQGSPINISYEDNGLFNLNVKSMLGTRVDYDFGDKLKLGATWLRLKDRPITQKVNLGEDPIKNNIFGMDFNYNDDMPWLTNAVDKLPFYSTKAPSSISLAGEAALLKPGHNKQINLNGIDGGVVGIDDFEGAVSGFTLGGFNLNEWTHASTPLEFPESQLVNDLRNSSNRAKLLWYQIDNSSRRSQAEREDPYTRQLSVTDLFNRQVDLGQNFLFPFDLTYYPQERGVYNFDIPEGYPGFTSGATFNTVKNKIELNDPRSRWGGIMRYFQNSDFEAANYEFIEFWVLNPFMDRSDGEIHRADESGEMVFHLGNISEDILKDNLQFYENANDSSVVQPLKETNLGRVSLRTPINTGFDIAKIDAQDTGLDGLDDGDERVKFAEYLSKFPGATMLAVDPAGDNYEFYNDPTLTQQEPILLNRFKGFNNPQGNAPRNSSNNTSSNTNSFIRGNAIPEDEDLNKNRSLDQGEAFFEYRIPFKNAGGELDTINHPYYRQTKTITKNNKEEKWYRFQIPLTKFTSNNNINSFRAIQFMRLYVTNFESAKTFRMVDFQLVRNQWRKSAPRCFNDGDPKSSNFSIDVVGLQENSERVPFGYKTPKGIIQERITGTFGPLLQDEKSMVLRFENLQGGCQFSVNKVTRINLNQYKRLQMFVHAEELNEKVNQGDLAIFVKVGKDLINNYYEYELPLQMSDVTAGNTVTNIWPDTNFIDLELSKFTAVKKAKLEGGGRAGLDGSIEIDDPDNEGAVVRIKGVPSLGLVKMLEVGIRSRQKTPGETMSGQVWVNELRCTGLEEKGGVAALARMQVKMADLAEINLSTNYSSIGFGALDQRLAERQQEEILTYDAATTIQVGKLFPEAMKLNLPFFAQYSKSITTPRWDPYQLDLTTQEVIESSPGEDPNDIRGRAQEIVTTKSYNVTNAKLDLGTGKLPWSPKNISATYAWTETEKQDPIISKDLTTDTKLGIDYRYSTKPLYISPFKFLKSKHLKLFSDFGLNFIPNSVGFNTNLNRLQGSRTFRLPKTPVFQFDDRRFRWERTYNLDWDITKSIRFTYKAQTSSIVDELRQVGIADDPRDRLWVNEFGQDTINLNGEILSINDEINNKNNTSLVNDYRNQNLRNLGRSKQYGHDIALTYRVPFKNIPVLDWVSATADMKATYGWNGGPLIYIDEQDNLLGNVIQNTQNRSANATFSFDRLYNKIGYLKKIENQGRTTRPKRTKTTEPESKSTDEPKPDTEKPKEKRSKDRQPSKVEKVLIRPLLLVRSVRLSYKEDLGTMLPGFMPQSELLGLSSGFAAPGLGFAAGFQPNLDKNNSNNWLQQNKGWFNPSPNFNDQSMQSKAHNINAKIKIEPFKDFDIDIDFNKDYRRDHTEVFKQKGLTGEGFAQLAAYDIGSFKVTHYGLNTLFEDNVKLLQDYKQNRILVSQSLPNNPNPNPHEKSPEFTEGYGPLSYQVNVPAFLAAYTGQDVNKVSQSLEGDVSKLGFMPKPNWQLQYNGLSKLEPFKKVFKSFTLKHAYKSTMGVSRFNTSPEFNTSTALSKKASNGDYYAQIEIPSLSIDEQFSPIIGFSFVTQGDMKLNLEWKKSRTLNLNLQSKNLSEDSKNEVVFGFGYIVKDFKGFSKKKQRTRKPRGAKDEPVDEKGGAKPDNMLDLMKGIAVVNDKGRTLTANMDLSFRDNVNTIYQLDNNSEGEAFRGSKDFLVEPSLEYQMYKNLALRWYASYRTTNPYNTNSNKTTAFQTGVTARFTFSK